jgi:hypothetical protein
MLENALNAITLKGDENLIGFNAFLQEAKTFYGLVKGLKKAIWDLNSGGLISVAVFLAEITSRDCDTVFMAVFQVQFLFLGDEFPEEQGQLWIDKAIALLEGRDEDVEVTAEYPEEAKFYFAFEHIWEGPEEC